MTVRVMLGLLIAAALILSAGCFGSAEQPVMSPSADSDPARAAQAKEADRQIAEQNREAERNAFRGAISPESGP